MSDEDNLRPMRCPKCRSTGEIISTVPLRGEWTAIVQGVNEDGVVVLEGLSNDFAPSSSTITFWCHSCRHEWESRRRYR